jgi:hypothetical protein
VIPGTSCLQVFLCTCVCASFHACVVQSSQSCQRISFLSRPQCLHRVEQPYLKNARPSSCRTTTSVSRGCIVITGQSLVPLIHTVDQWRPRLRKYLSLPLPLSVPEIEQKPAPARQRRPRPPTKSPRSCRSPPTHPFPPRRSGGQGVFGQYDILGGPIPNDKVRQPSTSAQENRGFPVGETGSLLTWISNGACVPSWKRMSPRCRG